MTPPDHRAKRERPARADYDQALKRLLTRAHDGLLQLVAPDLTWVGEHSPELPAVRRQADIVWEVARPSGQRGLLHIELQNAVDDTIGERLADYAMRLLVREHLPVRSVVIFLREASRVPSSPFVIGWDKLQMLRYDFNVVRLWEVPQERILNTEHYALWPLASLMAGATPETILDVAERIAAAPAPLEERSELTGLLAMLATRRLPYAVVQEVLRRNRMLLDKLAEGSEAVEVWREQGREQGRQQEARTLTQESLEGRFGVLPGDIVVALKRADEATLRALIRHVSSETMEQVRQRLGLD